MHGFGSHTYSFINADNQRCWVKFQLKAMQGIANLTNPEAAPLVRDDRESHQRDLFEAIELGDCPKWRFCVQIMPESDAGKTPYNPFDLTKVWGAMRFDDNSGGVVNYEPNSFGGPAEDPGFKRPCQGCRRRSRCARSGTSPGPTPPMAGVSRSSWG
jgi:catalase